MRKDKNDLLKDIIFCVLVKIKCVDGKDDWLVVTEELLKNISC
jgi:hypothetical protein